MQVTAFQSSTAADALLEGLNPEQSQAVQHTEGPLLILAGAGTGKTNVLTRRIAYLLLTQSALPSQILAVTFTNKAAREMAERTEKLVGHSTAGMWLGTFHRLGVRFLRQHAERIGLRPQFVILDPDDQQRLVSQILKDAGLDTQQFPPRLVANLFNRWKDHAWGVGEVPTEEYASLGNRGSTLYAEYQSRLTALNAVDFGDLLLLPLQLLRKNADLLQHYQNTLRYILVDEYQDTNVVQYQFLKLLAAGHNNLCVVGDDDQSIYSWRGAQVANILRFEKDFPGTTVIRLEQNYRSSGHILAAANAVIANNRQRHGKQLWTSFGDGNPVEVHPQLDDREEARFVADAAWQHTRAGGKYEELAVLVRTAAQTRAIEEAFIRAGLPYTVVGGLKFYDRKEIRDALAYLRLIANTTDDLAFQRIVNVPRRGVGDTTLATIDAAARQLGQGYEHATARLIATGELTGKIANALQSFLDKLQQWRMLAQMETPDRLTERVLQDSGYTQMLHDDKEKGEEDAKTREDNLKELCRALQEYPDLGSFLDHVALVSETDTSDTNETIKLMTIHAAKGLEFHTVFLPGFEEGLFPHQRAMNEEGQKGLEEERRLAYVALTRARRRLVISFANARRLYGQYMPGIPSRFLAEIPQENATLKQSTVTSYGNPASYSGGFGGAYRTNPGSRLDSRTNRSGSDYAKPSEPLLYTKPHTGTPTASISNSAYSVGQKVHHLKFGPGLITAVEGSGEATKLTITFKHAGEKRLLASLANLQNS
jgi:DNA helicase-2/ATP-dependent DNA helicase PcrA